MPDDLTLARRIFVDRLTALGEGRWEVVGDRAVGPGASAAEFRNDEGSRGHVDIGFILDRTRADPPVKWLCSTGVGETPEAAVGMAVEGWVQTMWPVIQELDGQPGVFAEHFHAEEAAGWHAIQGPWVGLDRGDGVAEKLGAWAESHPVLATIAPIVIHDFTRRELNCVKILIASGDQPVTEVMVNGVRNDEASNALDAMDWPRAGVAMQRSVVVFVEPEPPTAPAVMIAPAGPGVAPQGPIIRQDFLIAGVIVLLGIAGAWALHVHLNRR
jgi:hypothetical protein